MSHGSDRTSADAAGLLERHVADFNTGVTSGDFGPMVDRFEPDAEVVFAGAPFGPFRGRDAIRAVYRDQPPDDTITVVSSAANGNSVHAAFVWDANPDTGGTMDLEIVDSRIKRLIIGLQT